MENKKEHTSSIEQLKQIHSMMEESTKFISLSGLSGIMAGLIAFVGAAYAYYKLNAVDNYQGLQLNMQNVDRALYHDLLFAAIATLLLALGLGILFTYFKTKKRGQYLWTKTSQRLLIHLSIPLLCGGIFSLALAYHGLLGLIAPCLLIFYGLSLINASKYTLRDIYYLGLLEVLLGLIAAFSIGYGLVFWALGFGLLHIIYGSLMYFKYDRT